MSVAKALFFLPTLDGGGAEMNAVRMAGLLRNEGVIPTFAVARGPGSYARYLPADVAVHVLNTGAIQSSTIRLFRSLRPLARLLDELRPDVAVPVMPPSALALLAAVRRSRHKPRVAISLQCTLNQHNRGLRGLFDTIEGKLVRRMFPQADHVIALSRGVAADIAAAVPVLRDRIDVVHNIGLPLPAQIALPEPDVSPPKPGCIRYIACGRLVEQKGYPFLLQAFARVVQEQDAELHILGHGPLKSRLGRLAKDLGIGERIKFLGFRGNPFLHMQAADVFVLSSLWEGFGNVIVEAMAMETPVISTNCPHGPDEIIRDGENGMLVPPGDAGALAATMLRLARDEELRKRLAQAGKVRAQAFSAERIAAQYAAVLRSVASRGVAQLG
jgi:glycosyltransferase involved in cell wall biosynthesis